MNNEKFKDNFIKIIEKQKEQPERFNSIMDLRFVDCNYDEKWAEVSFQSEEWCLNPYGAVHGGVIASLLDTAMGMGAAAISSNNVNTTDMSVSYLKAMTGESFVIRCRYNQIGRTMIRAIGEIIDRDSKKICATGMASYINIGGNDELQ